LKPISPLGSHAAELYSNKSMVWKVKQQKVHFCDRFTF